MAPGLKFALVGDDTIVLKEAFFTAITSKKPPEEISVVKNKTKQIAVGYEFNYITDTNDETLFSTESKTDAVLLFLSFPSDMQAKINQLKHSNPNVPIILVCSKNDVNNPQNEINKLVESNALEKLIFPNYISSSTNFDALQASIVKSLTLNSTLPPLSNRPPLEQLERFIYMLNQFEQNKDFIDALTKLHAYLPKINNITTRDKIIQQTINMINEFYDLQLSGNPVSKEQVEKLFTGYIDVLNHNTQIKSTTYNLMGLAVACGAATLLGITIGALAGFLAGGPLGALVGAAVGGIGIGTATGITYFAVSAKMAQTGQNPQPPELIDDIVEAGKNVLK